MSFAVYTASVLLVLGISFVVFRVVVRRDYLRNGKLSPAGTLLQYVAFGSWAYQSWLNRPLDWPDLHVGPVLRVLGWILFAGGVLLTLALMARLGVRRSHGREVDALNQSGLYMISRNPQAVAFLVAMIGYGLLWPTWAHAGSIVLVGALCHMMVLTEEEHLLEVFGEEYRAYCEAVPRYLGRRRERLRRQA